MPTKPDKPTRALAMLAFCHDCLGQYQDGKVDCENTRCALYTWMPYRKKDSEPDLTWLEYNPKKKGLVTWADSKRDLTDEQRQEIRDRFTKNKKKSKSKNEPEEDDSDLDGLFD